MDSKLYTPIKDLGQNFLLDKKTIQIMVGQLEIAPNETVLEIGAGLGSVTEELVKNTSEDSNKVIALEIDSRFIHKLESMFLDNVNVQIINEDVLRWLPSYKPTGEFKIIGSLPYYITSPIVHSILKLQTLPSRMVILIQKEVAERIAEVAPDSTYLSVVTQTFYNVEYIHTVDKAHFDPEPQVHGGILKMTKKTDVNPLIQQNFHRYEGFLHKGFSNPRKMLNKVFTSSELEITGINGTLRPQNLDAKEWIDAFLKLTQQ